MEGWKEKKEEKRTTQQQPHHQIRHQTPLGIMHIIPIPHPRLRLPAHLPFLPTLVPRRREPRPEMVNEVLDDEARFGEHEGRGGWGRDGDEGGLAERVDLLELGRREHGLPLVGLEIVGDV